MIERVNHSTVAWDSGTTADVVHKLESVDWDFSGTNSRDGVHDIHPYPAKFIPQIPRELIRLFHPGDRSSVLDPFCGSGTSLVEAVRANVPAIGVDIHPLAILITRAKTTPLQSQISPLARDLVKRVKLERAPIPRIPRLDHWFLPHVQQALANLVRTITQLEDTVERDCLKVALSRIIVRVSNQESNTRYAAVRKQVTSEQVYELFLKSVSSIERALSKAYGGFFAPRPECRVINQDILHVTPDMIGKDVGLVVTSPPYPNAYEYWLYHKYRMYWLGMDPEAVREAEIGARPHYFRKNPATEADFERQMSQVLLLLSQVMKPGALACFLVGRSVIRGRTIDNDALLERAATFNGFRLVARVGRSIPTTKKAFNPVHSTINRESIMLFRLAGT